MGFIKHFDGRLKDRSLYTGWVNDKDARLGYEKEILAHTSIRLISTFYVS